jgi:hypothetical protein
MTARLGPISLPLLAGQNQKVDPRLQAPQEFASVVNVEMTRDGRQSPRRGFGSYGIIPVAGQDSGSLKPIRCVGDRDLFVADSGDLPHWTYAHRAHVRSRAQGTAPDVGFSTARLTSVAEGGTQTLIPVSVTPVSGYRGEREQTSATADTSTTGEWIATANLDSGAIVVIWRSRDTLEVIGTQRIESTGFGDPLDASQYVQCAIACSPTTRKTVVVAVRLSGAVVFIAFDDAGEAGTITDSGYTAGMAVGENGCIDAVASPNDDSFIFIMGNTAGGTSGVQKRAMTAPHVLDWSLSPVGSTTTAYTMHCLDVSSSGAQVIWAIANTDSGGLTRTIRMGLINEATGAVVADSAALTLGSGLLPGIPFVTHKSKLSEPTFHAVAFTTIATSAPVGTPTANVYVWDGVAASSLDRVANYTNGVVAGRVLLNAIECETSDDDPYYEDTDFRRLLLPMMSSGFSLELDTDLAYDASRPVFLMNIGANFTEESDGEGGWTRIIEYELEGTAEHGLLALSGEVGQATHPYISPIYTGSTGWTMGAPSKVRRIESTSGDTDTDLTGAYCLTFDVSVVGKSRRFNGDQWRRVLRGLPRQGRIALFKPMRAEQCELAPIRANETIIPGLTANVCDGVSTHSCGFLEAPIISDIQLVASAFNPLDGTYSITAVFEWTDASGRRYQSAPAIPRDITITPGNNATITFAAPVATYEGLSVAVYRTVNGGSEFMRDGSLNLSRVSSDTVIQLDDSQLLQQERIYSPTLGEVPNDPPPSAQRFARTRDRVWAYGLDRPEVVQASKLLTDGRGIVWSNSANYFIVFPEPVVAVETLDETAVVFTARAVYTIGGSGPDDTGIGTFTEPGRIPGYVGCVSPRSVVSADAGIYFQSQRGIELIPRGFGAAQWVGQPVMTDIETYSLCRGAVADGEGDRIVWTMVDPATWDEVELVLDCRAQSWSKWDVAMLVGDNISSNMPTLGISVGGQSIVRGNEEPARVILWGDTESRCRIQAVEACQDRRQDDGGAFYLQNVGADWVTGWCRFNGTQGWQIVRRASLLITPVTTQASASWILGLTMAFNDNPEDTYSVNWSSADLTWDTNQSLTLEVALPVVQFESIQMTVEVSGTSAGCEIQLHSIALCPETEGARVASQYRR